MNLLTDPWLMLERVQKLERENEYLIEQVRTLSARLHDKRPAEWRIATVDGASERPQSKTAYARQLITDERLELANVDVWEVTLDQMKRSIEKLPEAGRPIDHIWTITLTRDYHA
jgi:hypothetical protein